MAEERNNFNSSTTGLKQVTRFAPIRLGPDYYIHNTSNHCSYGITSVTVDSSGFLVIYSDFKQGEMVGYTKASVDLQLASRGFNAGCSGGGPVTKVGIYRESSTPGKPTRVRADDPMFTSLDNLWYIAVSIAPVEDPSV